MLKYEHELDLETENSPSLILKQIKKGSKVLELGPATGYMTRYMKEQLSCTIYCIELDPDAAEVAKQYCDRMIVANLEDLQWSESLQGETFDYVIFADVLEHLSNPAGVLRMASSFVNENGTVITSIPNIAHNAIIMGLMKGDFEYKKLGLLDNTHIRFFTKKSILKMIDDAGLSPVKISATVVGPEETEFRQNYANFPETLQKLLIENEEGHIYQYIVSSKTKRYKNESIYDESIRSIEDRYNIMQVYWLKEGLFSEVNSVSCSMHYDDQIQTYELPIPSDFEGVLRIDPGNWSGLISVQSLKLIGLKEDTYEEVELEKSSVVNNFNNLSLGDNVALVERGDLIKVLSLNQDPQLLWTVKRIPNVETIKLQVKLSATKDFSSLQGYIKNSSIEINRLIEQLGLHIKQLEEEKYLDEIHNLANEAEVWKKKLIDTQQKSALNKDKLTSLISESEVKENTIILLQQKNGSLNTTLQQMMYSRSWRLTAPLRKVGFIAKRTKRIILNLFYALSEYKFKMTLQPIHDLEVSENNTRWRAIGRDPAFWLKGKFPTGWVVMRFTYSSDESIPLKMYWDIGAGLSEMDSTLIGRIPRGKSQEHKIVMSIPLNATSLRLDPGEKETEFHMYDVTFRKISQMHLFYYAFRNHWIQRGYTISSFFGLMKKVEQIRKISGISGVRHRIKGTLGLNQEGILGQDYQAWVEEQHITQQRKSEILHEIEEFKYKPVISVLVPVYNVEEIWLRKCIDSVRNQLYTHWELCLADDASPKPHVRKVLENYAAMDSRIKVVFREINGHISESSNSALELATGEFIGLLDNDDELTIDALYENVKLLNTNPDADMIYSDEDKISPEGLRHSPFFKPDWAPDMLLTHMYTCHFGVYRTDLVRKLGGFRKGYEGSQDFDLALRITESTKNIYHIPKVLYHWRTIPESTASGPGAKNYTHYAGLKTVEDALKRRNIRGWIEELEGYSNFYRVHYNNLTHPLVSIIIPTRDGAEVLSNCLESIVQQTNLNDIEIIIVDNGSRENDTYACFDHWGKALGEKFKVLTLDMPFNYSKLNNIAAQHANGELLLLLNNDIEVMSSNWLDDMVGQAMRKNVGAVGAYLLYPDNTVQHSGLALGLGAQRSAGDGHHYRPIDDPGYFGALLSVRNVSAVTGACLMIRKNTFMEVGGLDENLTIAYNDVDFCIKIREKGYLNLWLPYVQMIHHESKTRGHDLSVEKITRLNSEAEYLKNKWGDILLNDPYYNPNLSLDHGYSIRS